MAIERDILIQSPSTRAMVNHDISNRVASERIVNDVTHNLCFMLNLLENVFSPLVYHESEYFKIG